MSIGFKAGYKPWEVMRMTIPQIELMLKSLGEQKAADYEERVCDLHMMGGLNTFAFNDPKKYPKLQKLLPKKKLTSKEDAELRRQGAAVGMRVP
jgi:hypothetical protein